MRKKIHEILEALKAANGIKTDTELEKLTGVSQPTISRILSQKTKVPKDDAVRALADFFGLSTDQLRGYSPIPDAYFNKNEVSMMEETSIYKRTPVLTAIKGMAKMGQDGYYEQVEEGIEGYIELPMRSTTGFALIARGDSMYPAIKDGFVVWCDIASQFVTGDNVAIHKRNGAKMIKEYRSNQNGYTELKSINGGEVLRIPNAEIESIYLIRGVLHPSAIRHLD
ncbi:helix-turn-helix domain-containing protein [Alishewanella sp. 16-MA]|uniref:Helix-turn-helix domain-containing protein n=1 Tax=Alishewanella maricola TaxID=2795740 RepID=A0ABS8C231_9ALTE|nr:S24 family peptidase [Alishewanella maricola]MCB5226228.1 helix-turn-helix domain-containing protein [Alishewanella maricola]